MRSMRSLFQNIPVTRRQKARTIFKRQEARQRDKTRFLYFLT